MVRPNWAIFQKQVDAAVDATWAEPVEFHPWTNVGFSTGGGPDPAREVLAGPDVVAAYMTQSPRVLGEAAAMGGNAQQLAQEVWASIQTDILGGSSGDPYQWKEYDRVYWPKRGEWFSILYVAPSSTFRNDVHLSRLNAADMQATLMQARPMARPTTSRMQGRRR